jgi:hypothetical protein
VSDMECRASPVLGMHIPLLRRACDVTTAFEAFYQEIFTSSCVGGWTVGMGSWVGVITELWRISPCPTVQAAMARPYIFVGI